MMESKSKGGKRIYSGRALDIVRNHKQPRWGLEGMLENLVAPWLHRKSTFNQATNSKFT